MYNIFDKIKNLQGLEISCSCQAIKNQEERFEGDAFLSTSVEQSG
jgi:hypothetical protein